MNDLFDSLISVRFRPGPDARGVVVFPVGFARLGRRLLRRRSRRAFTYLSSRGIAVEANPTLVVCARPACVRACVRQSRVRRVMIRDLRRHKKKNDADIKSINHHQSIIIQTYRPRVAASTPPPPRLGPRTERPPPRPRPRPTSPRRPVRSRRSSPGRHPRAVPGPAKMVPVAPPIVIHGCRRERSALPRRSRVGPTARGLFPGRSRSRRRRRFRSSHASAHLRISPAVRWSEEEDEEEARTAGAGELR